MQDIGYDTGYDTRRRGLDGVLACVSQTAVYDTCLIGYAHAPKAACLETWLFGSPPLYDASPNGTRRRNMALTRGGRRAGCFSALHHFEYRDLSASNAVACPHRLRAGGLITSTGSDAKTPHSRRRPLGVPAAEQGPHPRAGPAQAASNQQPCSSVAINESPQFHWVAATIWPHHRCTQIGEEPVFRWLWRPFALAVVLGTVWALTLILWAAVDSLFGTDREIWTGVLACWVVIWFLRRLWK